MIQVVTGRPKRGGEYIPTLVRLRNRATGKLMRLDTDGETENRDHAWLGTPTQAMNLEAHARLRGDDWPYTKEARNQ